MGLLEILLMADNINCDNKKPHAAIGVLVCCYSKNFEVENYSFFQKNLEILRF